MEKNTSEQMTELTNSELDRVRMERGMPSIGESLENSNNGQKVASSGIELESPEATDARVKAQIAKEASVIEASTNTIRRMLGEAGYVPDANARVSDRNFDKQVAHGRVEIGGSPESSGSRASQPKKPGIWERLTGRA